MFRCCGVVVAGVEARCDGDVGFLVGCDGQRCGDDVEVVVERDVSFMRDHAVRTRSCHRMLAYRDMGDLADCPSASPVTNLPVY
jgi:hypothetical protein